MLATLSLGFAGLANTVGTTVSNYQRADAFFKSGIGTVISAGLIVFGLIVIIFTLFKVVMNALKGNTTGAIKNLAIGLFMATLLFRPAFIGYFIDWMSNVWTALVGNVDKITSDPASIVGGENGTPPPAPKQP